MRARGAQIQRNTTVLNILQKEDDTWFVETDTGVIECEHVVSCSGNFMRKLAKWLD